MSRLAVLLLGPFEVMLGDRPIDGFESDKSRGLLAYLVVEADRPHRREVLSGLLWPDLTERKARANLRRVLANVRQIIGDHDARPPFLRITRQTIQFDSTSDAWVDANSFAELSTLRELNSENVHQLEEAIDLYHGEFLRGFTLKDSAIFEEWALATREQLSRRMLDTLFRLARYHQNAGAYEKSLEHARHQLEIEPWREEAHRQIMELLAVTGQRSAALAQYETCRQLLADELGIEPEPETTALYQQIRAGEYHPEPVTDRIRGIRGYELRERIGSGNFGEVFRAYQPGVGRDVAIKVIRRRHANHPEFIRRFETEARLIARLEHPYIVPLYDYWRDPDGAYLVMRWLRAGSLASALERGSWKAEAAVQIVDQVASALSAAHHLGVIHRDIKPANILLDENGNGYLSDFGIAKDVTNFVTLTEDGVITGTPAYISPEQAQSLPVTPSSDIYSFGVVLYELLTGRHPFADLPAATLLLKHVNDPLPQVREMRPDLPVGADEVIQRATAKDAAERFSDPLELAAAFRRAFAVSMTASSALQMSVDRLKNPYKGLRSFEEADAADFYGRERLIGRMLARLSEEGEACRFLAVVGPSGSGKSSLVKAGLLPVLRTGALPRSNQWFIVEMLPGTHPLEELELGLLCIAANQAAGLMHQLRRDARGLLRAARLALPDDHSDLLLVVDQFEELFTLAEDTAEVSHFIANLFTAVTDPRSRVRVIITLRADFYDRPLMHPDFSGLMQQRTEVVVPLTAEELSQAIREPAARAGVSFAEGLVTTIVADVGKQPGALPLLQYALTELFDQTEGHLLTFEAYHAIDGVLGALGRRAELLYSKLNAAEQEITRQLFLRLITLGEGSEDTRRRVDIGELEALTFGRPPFQEMEVQRPGMIRQVIEVFSQARLLSMDRDPVTRSPTVEVAHEALLKEWLRLRTWLQDSRVDVRMQQALANGVREWLGADRDPSFLLRGSRLDQFVEWRTTTELVLTEGERSFLESSLEEKRVKLAEETARQAREKALERRAMTRLRALLSVLVLATITAVVLSVWAINQTRIAQRETRIAIVRELASAAISNMPVDPERSILLAMEAVSKTFDEDKTAVPEAVDALHQSLLASRLLYTFPDTNPESCRDVIWCSSVAFSPDGSLLATSGPEGKASVWAVASGHKLFSLTGYAGPVIAVAFSKDGRHLATASGDGTVTVWDFSGWIQRQESAPGTAKLPTSISWPAHESQVVGVAFSPDGSRLATAGRDLLVKVWDVNTGQALLRLSGHQGTVRDVAFTPDGTKLVSGSSDQSVRLWDAFTGEELLVVSGHSDRIFDIAISPDGRLLATASRDGTAKLWDSQSGEQVSTVVTLGDHGGPVYAVSFSEDGTRLATGGADAQARVWDVASGRELLQLAGHTGPIYNVRFGLNDAYLATGSDDGTVRLWDISLQGSREWLTLAGHPDVAFGVTYSPDGERLATASFDGTAAVWDATSGEQLFRLTDHQAQVAAVSYSNDGSRLATASFDGTAMVWDAASGAKLLTLVGHAGPVLDVVFSPDSKRLVTAGQDATARIWDAESGERIATLTGHTEGIERVAYSPDGKYLATAGQDGQAIVWLSTAPGSLLKLTGHGRTVTSITFSPDGSRLATASGDGLIRIWDATRLSTVQIEAVIQVPAVNQPMLVLSGHNSDVWDVTFSPNGKQLASISFDGAAKLWDADTGQELLSFGGRNDGREVAFSPDGKRLATTSGDGLVRLFVLPVDELLALAQSRVTRNLTEGECHQYLHQEQCAANRNRSNQ